MSWQTFISHTQIFSAACKRPAISSSSLLVRTAAAAGILVALTAAPQARAQTPDQAAAAAPTTATNPIAEFFQKLAQPSQPAHAPLDLQPQPQQEPQKVRYIKRAKKKKANPASTDTANASAAGAQTPANGPAVQSDWPNAADNAGMGDLTPIVIKTVREMAEGEPEDEVVLANELSDIDLAADPAPATLLAMASTDGRAIADAGDLAQRPGPIASQIASIMEGAKGIAQASWIESILLVLTGALAAGAAMRFFV